LVVVDEVLLVSPPPPQAVATAPTSTTVLDQIPTFLKALKDDPPGTAPRCQ
jgi:hypothetical protein